MTTPSCTHCKSTDMYPGFLSDFGQSMPGSVNWIEGELQHGMFGGTKMAGRPKWEVDAHRCQTCGHLELFVLRRD